MTADHNRAMEFAQILTTSGHPELNETVNLAAAFLEVCAELERERKAHKQTSRQANEAIEATNQRAADLQARLDVVKAESQWRRESMDRCIAHLGHIYGLIQHDAVQLPDGRRFVFTPPVELVREAWEGLSKAIREIPSVIALSAQPNAAAEIEGKPEQTCRRSVPPAKAVQADGRPTPSAAPASSWPTFFTAPALPGLKK